MTARALLLHWQDELPLHEFVVASLPLMDADLKAIFDAIVARGDHDDWVHHKRSRVGLFTADAYTAAYLDGLNYPLAAAAVKVAASSSFKTGAVALTPSR